MVENWDTGGIRQARKSAPTNRLTTSDIISLCLPLSRVNHVLCCFINARLMLCELGVDVTRTSERTENFAFEFHPYFGVLRWQTIHKNYCTYKLYCRWRQRVWWMKLVIFIGTKLVRVHILPSPPILCFNSSKCVLVIYVFPKSSIPLFINLFTVI